MIDVDLRSYLINHATILSELPDAADSGVVQQNKIDQDSPAKRIWFARSDNSTMRFNNGDAGLQETGFDVECMDTEIDSALSLAAAVKTVLDGLRGTMVSTFVHMCAVEDHDDDYLPRNIDDDYEGGFHVASLRVTFIHN